MKQTQPPVAIAHSPGTLQRFETFSSSHVPPRPVDVWLPPGYSETDRYPVLYMHDGQNLFLPGYSGTGEPWGVDRVITRLMEAATIPAVIVVGIWNGGDRRWSEYLPQKPGERPEVRGHAPLFPDRFPQTITSDAYLAFLVEELKPQIDALYPTLPDPAHTFVMGSSMGGLISLYALSEYPQVFGGAGCLSSHWVIGGNALVDYFTTALPRPGTHRLYFDFGTETLDADYEPFQRRMDAHLRSAGYTPGEDWMTVKFDGDAHDEASWGRRVHVPLEFLLGRTLKSIPEGTVA